MRLRDLLKHVEITEDEERCKHVQVLNMFYSFFFMYIEVYVYDYFLIDLL